MKLWCLKSIGRLSLFLYFWCISPVLYAAPGPDTLAITDKEVYPIADHLYWMQTEKRIPADSAYKMFQSGAGRRLAPDVSINSAFSLHYYWMTFILKNTSAAEKYVFYKFNYPFLNNIEVYKYSPTGLEKILKTGADLPFSTRGYPYHDFVLPLRLDQGESAALLIVAERKGERFSTTPELISAGLFKAEEQRLYFIIGTIVGIMFFNIVINLFLGISLSEKIHYLYAVYVFAALFWVLSSAGTDYQFLFPEYPAIFNVSQFAAGAITMILMGQLAIVFLDLRNNDIKSYYLLSSFKWILFSVFLSRIVLEILFPDQVLIYKILSNAYTAAIACIALSIIWAAIKRIRQGFKPAWFYLMAVCFLAFCIFKTCYHVLVTNDLSQLISPPTGIQVGLIIESFIIFAGIIYRYSVLKQEKKELAIKLASQKLAMTQNIISAQEEERKRLAQDLHDDLGATLSTLLLHITNHPDAETSNPYTQRSVAITKKALADLRNISHDLLPEDFSKVGLFQALRNRIDELRHSTSTRFRMNMEGDDKQLTEIQSITFYRIANELINNTIKHAKAATSDIDLVLADDHITLIFEDDGTGFINDNKKGIGLKNIHSRVAFLNGQINIDHNRQGTTVIIVVPL